MVHPNAEGRARITVVRWPLPVILALFVGFCCAFSAATPYRQPGVMRYQRGPDGGPAQIPDVGAPDEAAHVAYVDHLLKGKGFPVLVAGSPDYEAHQPPLYYLAEAGW